MRRDGRREPFDPNRLAESIRRAALAVGRGEELPAEELAARVALVLDEEVGAGVQATRAVGETVEGVLMGTGHHDVARPYILLQSRETPLRAPAATKTKDGLRVASLGRECLE